MSTAQLCQTYFSTGLAWQLISRELCYCWPMVKATHQRCLEQGDVTDLNKPAASAGMDLCKLTAWHHSTERKMDDTSPLPHNGLMLYKKQLVHSVLDSCMPSWLRLCSWWGIQAACEKYRGGVWLPTYFGSRKYCIRPQNPAVWCISLKVLHLGCCEQA